LKKCVIKNKLKTGGSDNECSGGIFFEDFEEEEFNSKINITDTLIVDDPLLVVGVQSSNIIKIKNITQNEYALMKMFNLTYSFDNTTDYKNINEQFNPIHLSKNIEGLVNDKYIKNSSCDLNNLRKELLRYNHNVLFAGSIHIEDGIIKHIAMDSSHYRSDKIIIKILLNF
jgi:hypothetical protein